uniref:DUF6876 domain-containing protein n=1 Tax=viral metagenome TaxID=1070528 RepID=A0A6M3IW27_9ZZZZ
MITATDLQQFTGTEHYYKYIGGLKLTDGVKYLAETAQCYWLLDIIASYAAGLHKKEEFLVCNLYKNADNSALFTINDGNDNILIKQEIPYTDFPMDTVKLYCISFVVLLPSEY